MGYTFTFYPCLVAGLKSEQLLDRPVAPGQPSVAGHGALQGSSFIGGYSSLAADRPPYSRNILPPPYSAAENSPAEFRPDVPWEFPREKLYVRQKIGEGSFGEVWRARVQDGILGRTGELLVAVKMLRGQFRSHLSVKR